LDPQEQGKAMLDAAANLQGSLIAAESQLSALQQIYTDSNVRVQSLKAQIAQMRQQLNKLGGTGTSAAGPAEEGGDFAYPSIKQLPVLGVTYYDLYRETKVNEAIYEFLTKQFEIAKVEEAKSLPSVKVLDKPNIPERKSFPPRLILMVVGAMVSLLLACGWVVGNEKWERAEDSSQSKILALEIRSTVKPYISKMKERWSARRWQIHSDRIRMNRDRPPPSAQEHDGSKQ
jgi:uncharacterized protein involved in exopolysaccharide biosynthesis